MRFQIVMSWRVLANPLFCLTMQSWRWRLAQYLEIRWWKRYLSDKDPDAYLRWKTAYWQQMLDELSPALEWRPGQRILDAGCGPAGIFIALKDARVVAIDPLMEQYGKLPHFKPEDYSDVHFLTSDIEHFSTEEPFDVIFCLNAINHVSDICKAYDVLVGMLKPGGKLVVSIDAHNHAWLKHLFRAIPGDALHPHQYSLDEYENFLKERGCRITFSLLKDKGFIFNYHVQVAEKAS